MLLDGLTPDTHVLIMSSHGMGPYYAGSHLLDLVIERLGLGGSAPPPPAESTGSAGRRLWGLRHLLPGGVRLELKSQFPSLVTALRRSIGGGDRGSWCRARAFAVPSNNMTGAIRVNLKGREPEGLVAPGAEYEALRQEITDALVVLENPETGRPAVRWVARVEDLYEGPRLRDMPDLFVEWDHTAPITTLCSPRIGRVSQAFAGQRTGDHWANGLLVGRGGGFRSGEVAEVLRTQDIGPTVLDFFDVESPSGSEGRSGLEFLRRCG
jgi:predicted AlkP superfamily phosphohydrolase/phosphomutase